MKKTLIFVLIFLCLTTSVFAKEEIFFTQFASVRCLTSPILKEFVWRMTGKRELNKQQLIESATYTIDRVIGRVKDILEMWPEDFRLTIYITDEIKLEKYKAYYNPEEKAIYISSKFATDGMLAHEVSHAIIRQTTPGLSSKAAEILSQYVDSHLWKDY